MTTRPKLPGLGSLGRTKRKTVVVATEDLVEIGSLRSEGSLPVLIEPTVEGVDLIAWAEANRETVEKHLQEAGGVLFRGFALKGTDAFERFNNAVSSGDLLEYSYRSTPRTQVSGRIYTSTEYPPDQWIPMHNEMAYSRAWPLKIAFHCAIAPGERGETPIADSREVTRQIPDEIRREFAEKKVMYVRNYGGGLDLSWQNVFQTESAEEVEEFCAAHGIELEWKDNGGLRTRQVCQGVATHPRTGDELWFNQAHLFHVTALAPELRESLLESFAEEDLPRNTYFGDGTPMDPAVLDEVRGVYERTRVLFPWRQGDVLLLDNMLTAHGRAPYGGDRKILVGMAEMFTPTA